MAQVALAWLLAKPGVSTVLIGASKLSQLEDNLGALSVKLNADEVRHLDQASPYSEYYPRWFTERLADSVVQTALNS